ncbi:MAG: tRNA (guanosine(37)-N1)-methyltransferase TrmD [Ethanoligenens sp.]
MRIDLLTLFPAMCEAVLGESIIGRARKAGYVMIECHDIRAFSKDKHRHVDDYPYGGGVGMIMQPGPIFDCFADLCGHLRARPHLVYLTPQGKRFNQQTALRFSQLDNLCLLCGHYEGVDERVLTEIVDEEISLGDFVLTGGELPALCVADAVARLLPGVLAGEESWREESIASGLLEYPQYTRPPVYHGKAVPEVLRGGHHAHIMDFRRKAALTRTVSRRPDLLETAELTKKDQTFLRALSEKQKRATAGT